MRNRRKNFLNKLKFFRILIYSVVFLMLGCLAVLSCGYMEDNVIAKGVVQGINDYDLRSSINGRIIKIFKSVGDPVEKGEVIIEFDSKKLQDEIEIQKSKVDELNALLEVKKKEISLLKEDPLPKDYRYTKIEMEENAKSLEKSKEKYEIYKYLHNKKVISKIKFNEVEKDYINATTELRKSKEDYNKVVSGLGSKIISRAESEMELMRIKLKNGEKYLELLKRHLGDYQIKAPEKGIITLMPYREGHYLSDGELAAKMSNTEKKKVLSYVDEKLISKITLGQEVRINSRSYDRFYFGYFKGQVIKIGELPVLKDNYPRYPVEIMVTEEPYELKLGSTAEIGIITGTEKILSVLVLNK